MKKRANSRSRSSRTYIDSKGYSRFKDSGKYVHRSVAEIKLGRKLKTGEVVHHKNLDKQDNSYNNLSVLPNQKTHYRIHKQEGI